MKNCICLAKRKVAKELANNLINSILWDKDWDIEGYGDGVWMSRRNEKGLIGLHLKQGLIGMTPRKLCVKHNGNMVWFPILQRIRIRCAIRLRVLWEAQKVV